MDNKSYVDNEGQYKFIYEVISAKIRDIRRKHGGVSDMVACQYLAGEVQLSHVTLLKALNLKFTKRTVDKMIKAGWLTQEEYDSAELLCSEEPKPQVKEYKVSRKEIDEAFKQGLVLGLLQAKEHYTKGIIDGRLLERQSSRPIKQIYIDKPPGLPMDRLKKLLNMSIKNGAENGEVLAARRAAGVTLTKWIKDSFDQDVSVDVR